MYLTREQWAAQQRAPTEYDWDNLRTSTDLSLYANVAEIAAATEALHSLYQDEGRAMRAAKQAAASIYARHPGDTKSAWNARFRDATPAEQDLLRAIEKHRRDRKDIAAALDQMRAGVIPQMARHKRIVSHGENPAAVAILSEMGARYDAAYDADIEEMKRKAAERPIDDAAWNKELERRGKLERWLNDPLGKGASEVNAA